MWGGLSLKKFSDWLVMGLGVTGLDGAVVQWFLILIMPGSWGRNSMGLSMLVIKC